MNLQLGNFAEKLIFGINAQIRVEKLTLRDEVEKASLSSEQASFGNKTL